MGYKCEVIIEKVKAKAAAANPDPSKRTILSVFEVTVTSGGSEVKKYTIDLKKLEVYEGAYKGGKPDVNLTVDDDTLEQLVKKQVTLEQAKESGKLSSSGDPDAIVKIRELTKKLLEE